MDKKLLGQSKPSGTSAASIYSPDTSVMLAEITTIIISNTTGTAAAYSIYLDGDGTTYDQSTALFYSVNLAANDSKVLNDIEIYMSNPNGNLAIQTDTANALTFTVFGAERRAN